MIMRALMLALAPYSVLNMVGVGTPALLPKTE